MDQKNFRYGVTTVIYFLGLVHVVLGNQDIATNTFLAAIYLTLQTNSEKPSNEKENTEE